ncbi:MAG: hypothetical protein PHE20_04085 [Patescibacteria group bacterium]|nr:hypothetical protein [Patescibacteria group bacterium]
MSIERDLKNIHALAKESELLWPNSLKEGLQIHWHKTIDDDKNGLISMLGVLLWQDSINNKNITLDNVYYLSVAELYFWTAANLEDDLSDNPNAPRNYLPLLSACRDLAWHYINKTLLNYNNINLPLITSLLLNNHAGNFQELSADKHIPNEAVAAASKSIFLLIGPILLTNICQWTKAEQIKLFIAGKYFLAAKQLADDVYDYKEDWNANKRTFAHYGLNKLPNKQELPAYYRKQAENILSLCQKSKQELKKITALKKRDCFTYFLKPLELSCLKALTKISVKP